MTPPENWMQLRKVRILAEGTLLVGHRRRQLIDSRQDAIILALQRGPLWLAAIGTLMDGELTPESAFKVVAIPPSQTETASNDYLRSVLWKVLRAAHRPIIDCVAGHYLDTLQLMMGRELRAELEELAAELKEDQQS